jgi:minor curlin subunit
MVRSFAVFLLLTAPLPALADQVSVTYTPQNAEEAQMLQAGLALYSLHRHLESGGNVRQWGEDNYAALVQQGGGNWGLIEQDGDGHSATLTQTGGGNAHAIFQGGTGATAGVTQTGGQAGITVQYGW